MVITEEARRFGGMGGATWTRENIWQRHCSLLPPLWLRGQGCFAGWRVTSPCRSTSSPSRVCGLVVLEVEEMSLTEVARSRRGEWDVDKKRVCDCMLLYFLAVAETRAGRFAGWRLTTPRPVTRRRVARLGWNGGWRPGTCT